MSSIQFNLLPDVKEEYISAERNRKVVTSIAFLVSAVALGIFLIVLFTVDVVQKKELSDADTQAKKATAQLQSITGLNRVVTIQNQLQTLSSLHQSKHATSRIFLYMPQLTPAGANVSNLSLDLTANTLQLTGTADSQATVNTFVDTLKYATYKASSQDSDHTAFTSVVLTSFSVTPGKATYTINTQFDPRLFSDPTSAAPVLTIKNQVTTRSILDDPANAIKAGGQ